MNTHDLHQLASALSGQPASVVAFFSLGIVGGLHCVGMCLPLSLVVLQRDGVPAWSGLLSYHISRTVTYAGLGWFLATWGVALQAALPSGAVLASVIALLLLYALGVSLPQLPALPSPIRAVLARAAQRPAWLRGAALGAVTPLLPCGLLYGAIFAALAAPTAARGALWMTSFSAGTSVMMLLPALGLQSLLHSVSPRTTRITLRIVAGLTALMLAVMMTMRH